MTETQLNILKELYKSPNGGNHTDEIISDELGIDKSSFNESVKWLMENGYAYEKSSDNQINLGFRAYRITALGAKKIHEIEKKNTESFLKKYGTVIGIIIAALGLVGVFFQIFFGFREDCRRRKELQIQQTQYKTEVPHLK